MYKRNEEALRFGSAHVEEMEDLVSGYSARPEVSDVLVETPKSFGDFTSEVRFSNMKLSMFAHNGHITVRIGDAHNASQFYESSYPSIEEANDAMVRSGILSGEHLSNSHAVAGIEIVLGEITESKLFAGGLKRRNISTL